LKKNEASHRSFNGDCFYILGCHCLFVLPSEEVEIALIGDISRLTVMTTLGSVAFSLFAFLVVRKIYKKMVFAAISEDMARSEKINVDKINLIYLLMVAVVIGLGIRVVGSLLTAAIVAIPAATSKNLSTNMKQYAYGGALAGGLSGVMGIAAHQFFLIPAGLAVIISGSVLFLISVLFRKGNSSK